MEDVAALFTILVSVGFLYIELLRGPLQGRLLTTMPGQDDSSYGEHRSHNAEYASWSLLRMSLNGAGVFILNAGAAASHNMLSVRYPRWALAAYHLVTSVPVSLQSLIMYALCSMTEVCCDLLSNRLLACHLINC